MLVAQKFIQETQSTIRESADGIKGRDTYFACKVVLRTVLYGTLPTPFLIITVLLFYMRTYQIGMVVHE